VYNGRHLLRACLDSIPDDVETIVVDDVSTDGAPEFVEANYPHVTVLRNDVNVGFGRTSNRGLDAATGRVRIVLNSDARFRPGALAALVAAFNDERVGVAGPRLVFPDDSHQTSAASFPTPGAIVAGSFLANEVYQRVRPGHPFRWPMGMAEAEHVTSHDVDWVKGACIAIRDSCVAAIGGFDPGYFMYVEETDLCWRATEAGFTVRYVADAIVEHEGGGSTGDPTVHAQRFLDSERRFFVRAYGEESLAGWRRARLAGSAAKVVALAPPSVVSRRVRTRWQWQLAAWRHVRSDHSATR
jgi:N-acetylglucosaminyl-diphospho-decaprenol L-rhamnosyltransferase